jgi:membrane protein DedA with SNARE-associated domain
MWPYALVYLASTAVDCIPIFAPPAWMLMIFLMLKFDLNPWITVGIGSLGTVTGRLLFMTYIVPWFGKKTLAKKKEADLEYLGERLSKRGWTTVIFVFLYALLPTSTTALFMAVGLAKVPRILVVPPFFLAHFIGNAGLVVSGKYSITNLHELIHSSWSLKDILLAAFSLVTVLALLFIDWHTLIADKKIRLKWRFWE